MRRFLVTATFVAVLSTGASSLGADSAGDEEAPVTHLSDAEKIYGLSFFWQEVRYNFAFFDQVPDLNWDSTYKEFIPRVLETDNAYDYYREMQRFCALLHDGHTNVNLPPHYWDSLDFPKIRVNEFDHRAFVINADSSLVEYIPLGSEIIEVDGTPTAEHVKEDVLPYLSSSTEQVLWDRGIGRMLRAWKGTKVSITFRRPDGTIGDTTLVRNRDGIRWVRETIWPHALFEIEMRDDGVCYMVCNSFGNEALIDSVNAHLDVLRKAKGVVIDLRNNGGGSTGIGGYVLSLFTDADTLYGSAWKTREMKAAYRAWGKWQLEKAEHNENVDHYLGNAWYEGSVHKHVNTAEEHFEVPVVVLAGRNTGSAAEDFLIFADTMSNVRVVGEPTFGSTGQPILYDLPGGGSMRVCTKRDTYPDGRDFVGVGVQPDVLIRATVEDVINGRDPVLDRGLAELRKLIAAR